MNVPTLAGISAKTITTSRLTTRILFSGADTGLPVLLLHGNLSSATWWEEVMLTLPNGYRGIAPDQRGFGDADHAAKIDATRGLGDLSDDAVALLDYLDIEKAHVVGNSLGGIVVWRMMMDYPERFLSITQVTPGSPYGFGGTKDVAGTPTTDDFAGSGGGLVNPELVQRLTDGDRSTDSLFSPRAALRALVYRPPFVPEREEDLLSAMLQIHIGEQDWPGDKTASPNWPYVAPGKWGPNNALSPKYIGDVSKIYTNNPKLNVLWIRGDSDLAVSNTAASDPGTWGPRNLVPNYPDPKAYPPQPMLDQTRDILEKYAANGGSFTEVVMAKTGHVPFIERLNEFNKHFHKNLA